jgi:uncharacterized protein YyaL (SSP411 family)
MVAILLGACGGGSAKEDAMTTEHAFTNRLIHEKSPYLLQHAHNPVDWYPWGPEALQKAKALDRPIFLSIGYSTCHWCHVMEHESFENAEIAAFLNEHFVPVKVDREERPDLDALYMTAVQGMTGSGGWPMSVFLTPERKPFFAGTYFPPEDRQGMPGFLTLITNIDRAWRTDREGVLSGADRVTEFLRAQVDTAASDTAAAALNAGLLDAARRGVERTYDAALGGFGTAPKFPTPHKLTFLLRTARGAAGDTTRGMVRATLDAMAAGGIHDHLGGGFHRYSTDARWLVPHFEKMLYDQAGLALAYTAGWQVFGDAKYATVVRRTLDYVLRDLADPKGGFYSAEDADSEGEEGTFYVWTPAQIDAVLGGAGPGFREAYHVTDAGNWEGKNILHVTGFTQDTFGTWEPERRKLFAEREKRPRPHRDDKIIVEWNGYMIEALARAGTALDEPRYVKAAVRAATFIDEHLWKDGRLLRHYRDGAADVPAYLEDYAYLGRGLLALYEATYDPRWLERSVHVTREMLRLFARPQGGFSLTGSDAETLLAPVVETYDGATPSGNSVAAMLLLRLGHLTADTAMEDAGWNVLRHFADRMVRMPGAHLEMLSALDFAVEPKTEVVVAGSNGDPEVAAMLKEVRAGYRPNTVTAFRPAGDASRMVALIPYLEDQTAQGGKPTAYVCKNYACRLPVHDAGGLRAELGRD